MSRDGRRPDGPLSRPIDVRRLAQGRGAVTVEASPAECDALARDFGIPGIRDLVGRFALAGQSSRLTVTGTVEAVVTQVCTVSLEPFEAPVREAVEVVFSDLAPDPDRGVGAEDEGVEVPDPIHGGRIDFGVLTAEFLALGIDPYPRRPGVRFEPAQVGADPSPFAVLRRPDGEAG